LSFELGRFECDQTVRDFRRPSTAWTASPGQARNAEVTAATRKATPLTFACAAEPYRFNDNTRA